MRTPHLRITVLRMMVVVAIVAAALTWSRTPVTFSSHFEDAAEPRILEASLLMPAPRAVDGSDRVYSPAERTALPARLTTPDVLDVALADPRIARLAFITSSTSKRATLAACYTVRFDSAWMWEGRAFNRAVFYVHPPSEPLAVYRAIRDAILAKYPGAEIGGDAYGRVPDSPAVRAPSAPSWRPDGRTIAAWSAAMVAILVVFFWPAARRGDQGPPPTERPPSGGAWNETGASSRL